jgi:prepilin-type N-terminal cleavage/methylation domain-containing protein
MIWRLERTDTQSGFTLIEMIVVIAILGLTLVLIGLKLTPVSPATHARAAPRKSRVHCARRAARL